MTLPAATPPSTRQFAPDLLKAVAIFGVVYIHTIWMVGANYSQYFAWLFRAAVPCFLIMFAYFLERSLRKQAQPLLYLWKRFVHVLTIFVVWSLIYSLFKDEWLMPNLLRFAIRHFGGGSWAGQFFFFILLQLIPLFPALRKAYEVHWLRLVIIGAGLFLYFLFGYAYASIPDFITGLKMRPFVHSVLYVFAGIALARGDFPRIKPWYALAALIIPVEFFILDRLGLRHDGYITPGVLAGSILLAAATLQSPISRKAFGWLSRPLNFVGNNTMTIFVANPLMLGVVYHLSRGLIPPSPGPVAEVLLAFLLAGCATVLCCVLAWVIKLVRLDGIIN